MSTPKVDALLNVVQQFGGERDPRSADREVATRITYEQASLSYRESAIARKAISAPILDAMRGGYAVTGLDADQAKALVSLAAQGTAALALAARYARQYGGGAVVLKSAGRLLAEELLPGERIVWAQAMHRYELAVPSQDWDTDPESETFREPRAWQLTSRPVRVHPSRVIHFHGVVDSYEHRVQTGGHGESLFAGWLEAINGLRAAHAGVDLLLRVNGTGTFKLDGLAGILDGEGGKEKLRERLWAIWSSAATFGFSVVDSRDSYSRESVPIAGVAELLAQLQTWVAGLVDIPVTRLFGRSPAGMNATGESDTANYDRAVESWRDDELRPRHERLLRAIMLAAGSPTGGVEPDEWQIEYAPLRTPTPHQLAETELTQAQAYSALYATGAVDATDIREALRGGKGSLADAIRRTDAQAADRPRLLDPPVVPPALPSRRE